MEMRIRKTESETGFLDGSFVKFVVETSNGAMVKTFKNEASAKRFVKTHVALGIGVVRRQIRDEKFNQIEFQKELTEKFKNGHKSYRFRTSRAAVRKLVNQGYTTQQSIAITNDAFDMANLEVVSC